MSLHVSPSQIATFRSCKRKWAWDKIEGVPRPQNPAAALGSETHELLENWLLEGAMPDPESRAGAIALSGLNYLPTPPVPREDVEREFRFEIDGVVYVGKIDLAHALDGLPIIHDHKTTSSFRWAKTPAVLLTDEQAVIYGFEALRHSNAPMVLGNWLYMETGAKRRARFVEVELPRAHVEAEMEKIHVTAVEMIEHRMAKTPALSLPPTIETCSAYGGCAYRENCNLSSVERMKAIMVQHSLKAEVEEMGLSLAEKMKQKKESKAAAAPPPVAEAPEPEVAEAPKPKGINAPKPRAGSPAKSEDVEVAKVLRAKLDDDGQVLILVMSPKQLREMLK